MPLEFRGRLAPHLMAAVYAAVVAFVAALLASAALRPVGIRVPWLVVALATGVAVLLWRYFLVYRPDGVAIDDGGIRSLRDGVALAWDDVRTVRFAAHPHELGAEIALLRYAVVEGDGDRRIAFCDKGPLGREAVRTPHGLLADVSESALLIALLAEKLDLPELLPPADAPAAPGGASVAGAGAAGAGADGTGASEGPPPPAQLSGVRTARRSYGLLPLLAKIGPNLAAIFGKLGQAATTGLKTFKLGTAAVSLGAYGLLFNWRSAAALLLMIAWHEYGHVHAMRRCGVPVRGIYFIPFLGGAAVHEAPIADRSAQAYVSLNGPLWGLYLTLAVVAGFYLTGQRYPWLAVVAALWAALNLFNLLPILPLDGGRALSAIAFSINSRTGMASAFGLLALGLVLAGLSGLGLLALLIGVGALEFATEAASAHRRRCFAALACAPRFDFGRWYRLQSLARTVTAGQATEGARAAERAAFDRTQALLRGRPMSRTQLGAAAGGYALLTVALAVIILLMAHVPGADLIRELFR
jgi:Zn-dependent protease